MAGTRTVPTVSMGVVLTVILATMPQPSHALPELYTHLTLIDPEKESHIANSYILVENGRIAEIGIGKPRHSVPAAHVHDMSGRHALPGFIDAHAHITLGPQKVEVHNGIPAITFNSNDAISERYGRIALAYGVTTVRDPGGESAANARYSQMAASGKWVGPEALSAGAIIEPPPFDPPYFAYPRTEAEWQAEAAHQAELGMKYFKLYTELTEAELATGIRVSHQHGLKAIAHLNRVSWTRAAQLGIDGLEHALPTSPDLLEPQQRAQYLSELGPNSKFMYQWFELANYDGPLIREMVRLVVEKRITVDMTLVVNEIVYNADHLKRAYPAEFRRYEDPETLASALAGLRLGATGWTAEDYARARAVMPKVLQFAHLLYDAGAAMMIGTDGHGGSWFYGRELALHVQAGIPAWAVLRMATSQTAALLGIGKLTGRIAPRPGFEADVTFLDGDPVADISQAGKVFGVLNNGQFFLSSTLLKGLAGVASP
jgi:imidazolonepropionase-like amidohydrolase